MSSSTETGSRDWATASPQNVLTATSGENWPRPAELYFEAGIILAVTLGAVTAIQLILIACHVS